MLFNAARSWLKSTTNLRPPAKTSKRRLALESLEDRALLAVAAFEVNLYEDVDGAPGELIADDTVEVGERFFVEITAQEFDPARGGLASVNLDIDWDPGVLREIDAPFDPSELVTPHLPVFLTGTLDNEAGRIDNFGGSAFLSSNVGRAIGNWQAERFALLHFEAIGPMVQSWFTMWEGLSGIGTVPVSSLGWRSLDFETQTITVLPLEPMAAEILVGAEGTGSQVTDETSPSPFLPLSPSQLDATAGAALELGVNFYRDAGGAPGELVDTVAVGESFFVEITAADLRGVPEGVGGLSVDVSWDASVMEVIDLPFDPADAGSTLVTASLPLFRSGSLDGAAGRIENLAGTSFRSSGAGEPIGEAGAERFGLIRFRALAPVEETGILLAIGESGVGLVGGTFIGEDDLAIDNSALTIVDNRVPPRIEVSGTSGPDLGTIQFTTELPGGETSTLVRPAWPDAKQYIELTNPGPAPLTISEIRTAAPDVTVDVPLTPDPADDLVLAAGETRRIGLTYAPSSPNRLDTSTQSFNLPAGLVILSNAENSPRIEIGLSGASTFDADINYDGRVNIADVVLFDDHFGGQLDQESFNPTTDPNGDGMIDMGDFGPLNVHFGQTRSAVAPSLLPVTVASTPVTASLHFSPEPTPLPQRLVAPAEPSTPQVSRAAAVDAVFGALPTNVLRETLQLDSSHGDKEEMVDILATAWLAALADDAG